MELNFREYYGQGQGQQSLIGWPTKPIYRPDAAQTQRLFGTGAASALFGSKEPDPRKFRYYQNADGTYDRSPLDWGGQVVKPAKDGEEVDYEKKNLDPNEPFSYWKDEREQWRKQLKPSFRQRYQPKVK